MNYSYLPSPGPGEGNVLVIDVEKKSEKMNDDKNNDENREYMKMLERSKERRIMQLKWSGLQFHEVIMVGWHTPKKRLIKEVSIHHKKDGFFLHNILVPRGSKK